MILYAVVRIIWYSLYKRRPRTPQAALAAQSAVNVPEEMTRLRCMRNELERLRLILDLMKRRERVKKVRLSPHLISQSKPHFTLYTPGICHIIFFVSAYYTIFSRIARNKAWME